MKLSKKARIIGLSAILIALIALGIGMLVLLNGGENDNTGLDGNASNVKDPQAEQLRYIQAGQVYSEVPVGKQCVSMPGELMRVSGKVILSDDTEQDVVFIDINSGEQFCAPPPHWNDAESYVGSTAFDADENIYNLYYSNALKTAVIEKNYKNNTQPYETIPLSGYNGEIMKGAAQDGIMMTKLRVDKNYFYMETRPQAGDNNLQVFTHDGKLYTEYKNVLDFDISQSGELYVLHQDRVGSPLTKYDISTKAVVFTTQFERFIAVSVAPQGDLVCVGTNSKVFIYNAQDGELIKEAMDALTTAPAFPTDKYNMVVDGEHNLYFPVWAEPMESKIQVYRYSITEDLRKDMQYTLTVTAPFRDEYMVAVIAQFERDNPNERVKYDTKYNSYADFTDNSDVDGYFEKANIKLLTGDFGDIFMTGGAWNDICQVYKTNAFIDLTERIKTDPSYDELDQKMLSGITIDGEIKGLPHAADYFYAQINTELAQKMGIALDWNTATWRDILALNERFEGTDKYLFSMYGDSERAFVRMLISNMPDVIDIENKKIDLRQQWF